jgi:hypothetical protein
MADAFLSYADADKKLAAALAAELERRGRTVWWDGALVAPASFESVTGAQLREAGKVFVLWTAEGAASEWVRGQARAAQALGSYCGVTTDDAYIPAEFTADPIVLLKDASPANARNHVARLLKGPQRAQKRQAKPLKTPRVAEKQPVRWPSLLVSAGVGAAVTFVALVAAGWGPVR